MKQKIPSPINLPKDKNIQFDEVAFVNGMTEYRLKLFIRKLWMQLTALANVFDTRRNDVPKVIDKIRNGKPWSKKDLHDRYQYGIYTDFIIQYDTLERKFVLLNEQRKPISEPIYAISVSEGKEYAKEQRKTA